ISVGGRAGKADRPWPVALHDLGPVLQVGGVGTVVDGSLRRPLIASRQLFGGDDHPIHPAHDLGVRLERVAILGGAVELGSPVAHDSRKRGRGTQSAFCLHSPSSNSSWKSTSKDKSIRGMTHELPDGG